ncbi:AEC family transporter [Variovorax sp. Sphag1AA]|uniref:AEC family transporter n=1 Tax=Variovorax sp. Sphag1AA TaxID=2587027 RepID=UPI0016115A7B|nr:AEC family transporter [Variovorax sp. Sphag1AA]MBB3181562.1 hypothetical protein [Variovorax sp. Sphag1AA]
MTDTTGSVLAATGPIFALILVGFLSVRFELFDASLMRGLGRYVRVLALPALLLRALATRPFSEVLNWRFLLVYALGSLAVFCVGWIWLRWWKNEGTSKAALYCLGMAGSNSSFVGYPVALQLLGPAASIGLALVMLVENLLIIPMALAAADAGSQRPNSSSRLNAAAQSLIRNPLIIAITAGIFLSAMQWSLPPLIDKTVQIVAGSASPLALMVIGGALVGLRPKGLWRDISMIAFGKLVCHPLAVLIALSALPVADPYLRRAAIVYAYVPMLGIYPVLAQKYGLEPLCAAALLGTTVASFVTINIWLALA